MAASIIRKRNYSPFSSSDFPAASFCALSSLALISANAPRSPSVVFSTTLSNGGSYSGVSTDTLTITAVTATMNGYKYRDSVAASPCAAAGLISNPGTLTVFPAPTVVLSAAPYTALFPGLNTTLSVAVSPTTASTYMWYKNGILVPGVTGNTYSGLSVDNFGTYNVTIKDANGCSGTSNSITLKDSANSSSSWK